MLNTCFEGDFKEGVKNEMLIWNCCKASWYGFLLKEQKAKEKKENDICFENYMI